MKAIVFLYFQSALQRMINRNQGKAGFSVSTFRIMLKKFMLVLAAY